MKRVLICFAGAVPLVLAVVGCGQKGPLYLPPKNGQVVTRPAGGAGAPPSESTPSGSLKQDAGPATQGAKPNPDKSDENSSTSQSPKRF